MRELSALPPPNPTKDAILEKLIEDASTYDAASLPAIAPYLTSDDREIRDAAANAVVILGDSAGGPILRKAAAALKNPAEAAELLKKADYVELPSATHVPEEK